MFVPIWTPTISVWDSWFIHSYAQTWHFCNFCFRFLDGIWWHIGSGYILIDRIAKDVEYFSTCLIHWINSFLRILFEDSVHCLFYLQVFRTCLGVPENLSVPLEGDRDFGELCGSHQGCQVPFRPPIPNVGLLLTRCSGKGLHLAMTGGIYFIHF